LSIDNLEQTQAGTLAKTTFFGATSFNLTAGYRFAKATERSAFLPVLERRREAVSGRLQL
jgi:hypothetical protein